MKKFIPLLAVVLFAGAVVVSNASLAVAPDESSRAAVIKLFQSLSDEQKKLALKDVKDKERYREEFPAVKRAGLPFAKLNAEQKKQIDEIVRDMTSEYGATRCLEVAKQTPDNDRYLNFFGEPSVDKAFGWRIAQHHLTLIYAEFGADPTAEFGPILLGGNPAKDLWGEEEKLILDLYAALSPEEQKAVESGKANAGSGSPIGTAGVRIGDLGEKAKALAAALLKKRIEVFSPDRQKILDKLVQREGGADELRLVIWGSPTKSHLKGGNYSWRIGSPALVCDWQTVGGNHLHMTLRVRPKT